LCLIIKIIIKIVFLIIITVLLIAGCVNQSVTSSTDLQQLTENTTASPESVPVKQSEIEPVPGVLVEVIYFHAPVRCATCLCWEEQITYVIDSYFTDFIKKGTLTYQVVDLGNYKNNDLARKYGTSSSQLFINTMIDGKDNIKFVQDLYQWGCLVNKKAFNNAVKNVIEQALRGEF